MKRTCHSTTPILLLIIIAMMPAIAAGASYWSNQITGPDYSVPSSAFNPPYSSEWNTGAGSYWSNQITGPDYSVPESAFNPPYSSEWNTGAGSYWSNQITGPDYSVPSSAFDPPVSPYQYDTPGALLPYDFSDTLPATPPSGQANTPYLYPQAVSLLPIYPDMVPMPVVPGNFGNTIPSAALLFPYQTGSPVPVSIPVPSQIPLVFPVAVIPDTADEDSGDGSMAPAPHPAPGEEVFISDLDVHEEYVRITNNGLSPVSMTGWKIVAGSTQRSITFIDWPQGNGQTFTFTLYPLTTLTVYYGKSGPVTATEVYWPSATNVWNDAGDTAFLYAPDGRLVSSLSR